MLGDPTARLLILGALLAPTGPLAAQSAAGAGTHGVSAEPMLRPTVATNRRPVSQETPGPTEQVPPGPSEETVHLPILLKVHGRWPTPESSVTVPTPDNTPRSSSTPAGTAPATATAPTAELNVALRLVESLGVDRTGEPVTSGVPLPIGRGITSTAGLTLLDPVGDAIPADFTPLARWGGAASNEALPIKWLLIDFQADVPANGAVEYHLSDSGVQAPEPPWLMVFDGPESINIETGAASYTVTKEDGVLVPSLAGPAYFRATSPSGHVYTGRAPVTVGVTHKGRMRAAVDVRGSYRDGTGSPLLDYTTRLWFYAGRPEIRLFHTIENNNLCPIDDEGQPRCYDIDSPGSVEFAHADFVLPTDIHRDQTYQFGGDSGDTGGRLTDSLLLYQDSSGTDHWDHFPTLTGWEGEELDTKPRMQSFVSFRGYQAQLGETVVETGDGLEGWLRLEGDNGSWSVGVLDLRQNFPKSVSVSRDGLLEVGLFPGFFGPHQYSFRLRAGEHKTHEIVVAPDVSLEETKALNAPLFAAAPSKWYVGSGALGMTAERDAIAWPDYESFVDHQLETAPGYEDWMDWPPNLLESIERSDFYGVFDYGDWPLDFEGYGVMPLNIKYYHDLGMWQQWARGSGERWFALAEAFDRHFADIDILHNRHEPRYWLDGVAFGHSEHDEEGFTNPHRHFHGTHPDTMYGIAGLLTYYYLTGYDKAHESAMEVADCIEYRGRNESQLCSYFPGECSGEGYAMGWVPGMYEAASRPVANNLAVAVAAFRDTGDERFLEVADALVDWSRADRQPYIHGPASEDDRHVRPWMLNMYLRALADYIDMRREFGLPESAIAEASYLGYADWLRTYAMLELAPIETGERSAYPYAWWFDGRSGIDGEDNDNSDPSINNWLLLGADAMAYAHRLSGDIDYLDRAERLFRTGSRDPWFEGDRNTYSSTKETVNSISFGHTFLSAWAARAR